MYCHWDCHLRSLGQHEAGVCCALNDSPFRAKASRELSELGTSLSAERGGGEDTVRGQVTSRLSKQFQIFAQSAHAWICASYGDVLLTSTNAKTHELQSMGGLCIHNEIYCELLLYMA